jgi:hypothetical protein
MKPDKFCCERFQECYERGEISYSYEAESEIDETEWFIDQFHHLYYGPFCGAFIKGYGFGVYDDKYPPAMGARTFKQRNTV